MRVPASYRVFSPKVCHFTWRHFIGHLSYLVSPPPRREKPLLFLVHTLILLRVRAVRFNMAILVAVVAGCEGTHSVWMVGRQPLAGARAAHWLRAPGPPSSPTGIAPSAVTPRVAPAVCVGGALVARSLSSSASGWDPIRACWSPGWCAGPPGWYACPSYASPAEPNTPPAIGQCG